MIATLLVTSLATFAPQDVSSSMSAPASYVAGTSYTVEVVHTTGSEGATVDAWRLSTAVLEVDGKPLGERAAGQLSLPPNSTVTMSLDVTAMVPSKPFTLTMAGGETKQAVEVFEPVPEGLNFMEMPAEELGKYQVLLVTNKGNMRVEFLPEKAPNHVRNFLDLSYSGFYDGILFHRVSPSFMIQGGCPNTKTANRGSWGTGRGPRMLDAEFNDTKHVRGILSMARGGSPNSASSQFFVMTKDSLFLDNQYSAFGRLLSGWDALDSIAKANGQRGPDGTVKPTDPQRIEKAVVLLAD